MKSKSYMMGKPAGVTDQQSYFSPLGFCPAFKTPRLKPDPRETRRGNVSRKRADYKLIMRHLRSVTLVSPPEEKTDMFI